MKEIKMENEFLGYSLIGNKTQTIRKGRRDFDSGERILLVSSEGNASAEATVKDVTYTTFDRLDDLDALLEGFSDHEQLKDVLNRIYGELPNDQVMTIVRYEL